MMMKDGPAAESQIEVANYPRDIVSYVLVLQAAWQGTKATKSSEARAPGPATLLTP